MLCFSFILLVERPKYIVAGPVNNAILGEGGGSGILPVPRSASFYLQCSRGSGGKLVSTRYY